MGRLDRRMSGQNGQKDEWADWTAGCGQIGHEAEWSPYPLWVL